MKLVLLLLTKTKNIITAEIKYNNHHMKKNLLVKVLQLLKLKMKLIINIKLTKAYNQQRWTVVKYFYCNQVNVKSICSLSVFFFRKLYFTTFQSIMSYFYCTIFHKLLLLLVVFLPLILKNIKNVVLSCTQVNLWITFTWVKERKY